MRIQRRWPPCRSHRHQQGLCIARRAKARHRHIKTHRITAKRQVGCQILHHAVIIDHNQRHKPPLRALQSPHQPPAACNRVPLNRDGQRKGWIAAAFADKIQRRALARINQKVALWRRVGHPGQKVRRKGRDIALIRRQKLQHHIACPITPRGRHDTGQRQLAPDAQDEFIHLTRRTLRNLRVLQGGH